MPSSSSAPPAAAAATLAAPASLVKDESIKFQITAGGARWICTIQSRAQYERTKALRSDSSKTESK